MADHAYKERAAGAVPSFRVVATRRTGGVEPTSRFSHTDRGQTGQTAPVVERLTSREIQVLEMVAQGLSNREIAQELVIGIRTVEKHISHIFAKLGVSSRPRAMLYAIRSGLVAM